MLSRASVDPPRLRISRCLRGRVRAQRLQSALYHRTGVYLTAGQEDGGCWHVAESPYGQVHLLCMCVCAVRSSRPRALPIGQCARTGAGTFAAGQLGPVSRLVTVFPLCCPRRHKQLLEQYKQKLREAEDATAFARDGTQSQPRAIAKRAGDAAAEPDVPADNVASEAQPAKRSDGGGEIGDVSQEARTNVMALHRSGKTVAQIRNHYLLVDYGLTEAAVLAIIHEGREEAKAFLRLLPALADAVTFSKSQL